MKKDVIYIDTEDDITAIIDKVKSSEAPLIALVPPKRVGVLQSIVNLKLLKRAAENDDKKIVLVTSDAALSALAAGLSLPVAKNLQSKPEIAEIPVLDTDDNDIIEGEELPTTDLEDNNEDNNEVTTIESESHQTKTALVDEKDEAPVVKKDREKRIPNFNTFRKRLFIISGLILLIGAGLVWALLFVGQAKVVITAQTSISNISKVLQLKNGATLDAAQNVLPPIVKQVKKTQSVDFTATGKKDVGEKATGTIKISPTQQTIVQLALSAGSVTVNSGTTITAGNGKTFTTDKAVTFTAQNLPTTGNGVAVTVTATASGSSFNGATGTATVSGGGYTATFSSPTAGGTDKTITIVSQDDVSKAAEQLKAQDANTVRDELKKQFASGEIAIQEGFIAEPGAPTATPAVDQEATTGKLTLETTYTLIGIKRTDLKSIYDSYLKTQTGNNTEQKVYESGDTTTQFSEFTKADGGYTVKATATAQIGPNIDKDKLANDIKGLRVGEVQQKIQTVQGVENVDVQLSPFWVSRVPNDTKHIEIQFTLKTANASRN